jgi:teichuronic acid biosynthesis glycosyltransferase TuaH
MLQMNIEMKDGVPFTTAFVIIGQQPWDTEIGSNCKNIALEISKKYKVLYVNSPLDRITAIRTRNEPRTKFRLDVINRKKDGLIHISETLSIFYPNCIVESINWINNSFVFDIVNRYNNYKFAKSIKKALKQLGLKNFILFNDNEIFKGFYLKSFLKPVLSIYYSRDYMVAVDYWEKHGRKLEPKLIASSDICVANSEFLTDYCREFNPNSYYIGQGCDIDNFVRNEYSIPKDSLLPITGPVVGYVGALQSIRLDIEIIAYIASERTDWKIVLVGPEDIGFKNSNLHGMKNVFFLGMKSITALPDYINYFDVCINPQLVNDITIGNYPRKIDEYLSIGKPVVATVTKTMESFANFVYLAKNKEEYIALIERALLENSKALVERRIKFAKEHTWEKSIDLMYKCISLVLYKTTL